MLPGLALSGEVAPKDLTRWKALLHVTDSLWSESSQADGADFFLSPNGASDYLAEYQADIEAFKSDANFRCKFPARAKFIAIELGAPSVDVSACKDYLDFSKRLSAKSISLVFSSYYLNNPSSAFGHTLLRFKKEKDAKESEKYQLLDYAANFAATVTTSNALFYAIKGTFGGFHGEFAVMPYFYKIREYNDFESRDLWDYELNINQEQIDWVIAHLWEMKQTYFDYFYISENCSYHILGLLNVANPDWKLLEKLNSNVPPVDTIKAIAQTPGLLKQISFRPSKRRVLLANYRALNGEEREVFNREKSKTNKRDLAGLDPESQARVLDALIEYFDFEHADAIVSEDKEVLSIRRELLIQRAETGLSTQSVSVELPENEVPHKGHKTGRISVASGHSSSGGFTTRLGYRFALHDLLDPLPGQNPNAIMEMGNFAMRYYGDRKDAKKLYMERADLIQVLSLSPFSTLIPKGSWRLRLGSERVSDESCDSCFAPTVESAYGLSFGEGNYKFGLFLHTQGQVHKELGHKGMRLGAGPESFFLARPADSLAFKIFAHYDWWLWSDLNQSYRYGGEAAFHLNGNFSIRLEHTRVRGDNESLIGANLFF